MNKKTRLFGLLVIVKMLVIAVISCSNGIFPDGSYTNTGRGNAWRVPGYTVIEQLEWLQENAQSNRNYIVVARLNEPLIPGNNNFGIIYSGRENITVIITTIDGIPRQTLWTYGTGAMLNVGPSNTLILDNINLQVSDTPIQWDWLVKVNGGKLQMTNSVISGNSTGRGVHVTQGVFYMGSGAVIHSNRGGVSAYYVSRVYMHGNASIRNNTMVSLFGGFGGIGGGVLLDISTLTMRDNAEIRNNYAAFSGGGVMASASSLTHGSHVYMFDNASIHSNVTQDGGGIFVDQMASFSTAPSTLNMHGKNVRISGNRTVSFGGSNRGGGVFLGSTYRLNISGGTIYGADANPGLANTVTNPYGYGAVLIRTFSGDIRVGTFCSGLGFEPCGFTIFTTTVGMNNTVRVVDGVLQ